MKAVILIPARYASSRYPGKPLVELRSTDGVSKPLIQRTWETAQAVAGVADVFVATDDERIAARVRDFGGKVVMMRSLRRQGQPYRCSDIPCAPGQKTGETGESDAPRSASGRELPRQAQAVSGDRHAPRRDQA